MPHVHRSPESKVTPTTVPQDLTPPPGSKRAPKPYQHPYKASENFDCTAICFVTQGTWDLPNEALCSAYSWGKLVYASLKSYPPPLGQLALQWQSSCRS